MVQNTTHSFAKNSEIASTQGSSGDGRCVAEGYPNRPGPREGIQRPDGVTLVVLPSPRSR
jgi:hypothetical protein